MLVVRNEAEQDIKSAFEWYHRQSSRLGLEFVNAVEATLERIAENPHLYPPIFREVRRALCRRFPYSIYFVPGIDEFDIVVIAVLHQRRSPATWRKRQR